MIGCLLAVIAMIKQIYFAIKHSGMLTSSYLNLLAVTTYVTIIYQQNMASVKRKLNVHKLEKKYNAIIEVEKGKQTKTAIAKQFGVPLNTLSTWLKSAAKLKDAHENTGSARKRIRLCQYPDIEEALFMWIKNARSQNIPLSGPMLQAKATKLAADLQHPEFNGSNGWLNRFKERHGITFRIINGEGSSVADNQVDDWYSTALPKLLDSYAPQDVYNADEMGVFYKLLPAKSLTVKGEQCTGGKLSKDRLTVLPCANMTGTDKLPLLVIGKALKPRCFKGVKTLPTDYTANKKAWMTTVLLTDWLQKLDRRFRLQK